MDYKLTTLKNKLRVLTVPMPSLESATVTVWVKTGSRNEKERISGISHFLEHMAFKGTKKYPSPRLATGFLDGLGAEYNAGTSHEWTDFYVKVRVGILEKAFEILSEVIINPILDATEIEKEKGTILEEIAMHEDIPMEKVGDVFQETIYPTHPLGRDIAGTPKSVKAIKREDFIKYRYQYYSSNNMLVTVAGGINEKKVKSLANKYFSGLTHVEKLKEKKFEGKQTELNLKLIGKKTEQAHFILGYPAYSRTHKDRFIESVLSTILGKGMSSRLFNEIRWKRGLAYAVYTSAARFIDTGYLATYEGVDPIKCEEALKVTLDQIYGLASGKYPIKVKEIRKSKDYLKGRIALALEDTAAVNDFFGERALFEDEIETPEEVLEKIEKVTIEDIMRVAKDIFKPEKLNLAIIGPYKDQARFEKLLV